ncbi:MAG: response regulator [Bradyrhizobium sp.]|uniref:response regulator n=1 Tax=Bradyrhizobium sp. TaxID=376 RepID=UPI001DB2C808|nr:response regulator [Bradyrhizobium sp.]MBV9564517.1 response regulator [Bradyrhizobium sp.]
MSRILVIDDQNDVRAMICMILRVNRFEVTEAATAAAGLQLFDEQTFDAAVVDVFLDDANGFDVIAKMREAAPCLPVVAISGMTSLDAASIAQANLVYLQKPFRPSDLLHAIETAQASAASAAGAAA